MRLIIWGFFKKLVIADRVAVYVNGVFNQPDQHSSPTLLMAAVLFSFQIYCDFSGYSDIAIGTARTMGFKLMTNFNRPYFATNIREFWAKWHISLSTWFRDYVYIPLGGNRVARSRMYFNLFIVFLLSGLWHGANWTFVIWGAIHACLIVGYQIITDYKLIPQFSNYSIFKLFNWLFTFLLVSLAWVFFRANSVAEAVQILRGIANWHGTLAWRVESGVSVFSSLSLLISLIAIGFMLLVEWLYTPELTELKHRPVIDFSFATICLVVMLTWGTFNKSMFIYFQF
jgi:D-alanyl-lipoteichoic acid acyltransferase DltB (MBOAT superfamily)